MVKHFLLYFFLLITVLVVNSCAEKNKSTGISTLFTELGNAELVSSVEFAKGFDIYEVEDIKKMVIYNPQNISEILATYYLADSATYYLYDPAPNFLITPLDSIAVFSATQLNAFSKLGLVDNVIAISESEYIQNPLIKKRFNSGQIVNLANNGNFYLEKTLDVNPNVIFYSPYNLSQKHPLAATNINMIPFFDFMESNPLGRAEWIKFTALFFNKEAEADSVFNSILSRYNYYKGIASKASSEPTVFSDKYYSGQWFMSGGDSYISQLFNDAGANYLWKDNENVGSINLDFEVVYSKAHDADFWRIVGTYPNGFSYENLSAENDLYKNFKAFKNRNVIFCDSKRTTYFETGTLEPHLLLADLIKAFHPELMVDYRSKYYILEK